VETKVETPQEKGLGRRKRKFKQKIQTSLAELTQGRKEAKKKKRSCRDNKLSSLDQIKRDMCRFIAFS